MPTVEENKRKDHYTKNPYEVDCLWRYISAKSIGFEESNAKTRHVVEEFIKSGLQGQDAFPFNCYTKERKSTIEYYIDISLPAWRKENLRIYKVDCLYTTEGKQMKI